MKSYLLIFLLFLLILASCGPQDPASKPLPESGQTMAVEELIPVSPARQVIIDTDMAVDDWFAILYLLQKPGVNVLAITVTGTGEAHCDPGVKNALGLEKLAEHAPIPVACGDEIPLKGSNVFPDSFRNAVDSMLGIRLPKGSNTSSTTEAVDLLAMILENAPEPVDILVLGPLTNLAILVDEHPDLKSKVGKIYLMGGAVNVPGNVSSWIDGNTKAEWNIFIDPYAANLVFESGIPIVMVGLDATNQCPLTMKFYSRIKADAKTPEAEFVRDA